MTGAGAAAATQVIAAPTSGRIFIDSIVYSNDSTNNVSLDDSDGNTVIPTLYLGVRSGFALDNFEGYCERNTSLRVTVSAGNWSLLVKYQIDSGV